MYYGKKVGVVYETRRIKGYLLDLVDGVTPIGKKGGALAEVRVETERPEVDEPREPSATTSPSCASCSLRRASAHQSEPDWWKDLAIIYHETDGK